jgi:hypothetical protein
MSDKIAFLRRVVKDWCMFPIGLDKHDVWRWFADASCYLGIGVPQAVDPADAMTAPETTPFQHLYYVPARPDYRYPLVAVMLKPAEERRGKISDSWEIIPRDTTDALMVYILTDPSYTPEPCCKLSVDDFLAEFRDKGCETWVAPPPKLQN